jgi:radical SAM superfamily enzyme YgiQ (UPF0313 family)
MYRDIEFHERSVEEVKQDIDTARALVGDSVETIFIGDSDSLVISTDALCEILAHLHRAFPLAARVTSYARAQTLRRRSLNSLKQVREAGLTRLHIGLETGSPSLLKKIRKGASAETMVAGCTRAKDVGFEVSLYVLIGIGGKTSWKEHASETARVLNLINPDFIRVRTLTPQPGTLVYRWWKEGAFEMPSPETILEEQRKLIEELAVTSQYLSDHVSNYAAVHGRLPDERPAMLSSIEDALMRLKEDDAFRNELEGMPYQRRL